MFAEFLLALALSVLALSQNVTITTQDSRMHFEGSWVVQDSGGHEYTATLGSSVSLTFAGTAIYWHATLNPRCGIGNVSIDDDFGVQIDASIGTSQNDTPIPAILFSRTGLQAGVSHSINITYLAHGSLGGPYLEMYNLSYTQDNTVTSTASSSTIPSSDASTSVPHKSNTGAIAGGVLGGLLGGLLVFGGALFLARRNLQKRPRDPPTSPYIVGRPNNILLASKSAPVSSAPSTFPSSSQSQTHSQPLTSEPAPTDAETHPPESTPLQLSPNRNEPVVAEDPPPPYNSQRNETSN